MKTHNDSVAAVFGADGHSARTFLECDMEMGLQPSAEPSPAELPRRSRAWLRPARPTVLPARLLGDSQSELQPRGCDTRMHSLTHVFVYIHHQSLWTHTLDFFLSFLGFSHCGLSLEASELAVGCSGNSPRDQWVNVEC